MLEEWSLRGTIFLRNSREYFALYAEIQHLSFRPQMITDLPLHSELSNDSLFYSEFN